MSRLHKPKAGFFIRFWVSLLYPVDGLFFKIRWRHLDRMPSPKETGVLVAINHLSTVDTILMARLIWQSGRIPRFLIKSGVFGWPVIGKLMAGAGQIPVYRGTADAAESLRDAATALERHEAVIFYPEGTTTKDPDNWPMQAKTGIARLVLLAPDIPVVPIGQWGAHKGEGFSLKRRTASASIGEPMDLSRWRGAEPTAENLRAITDEIMSHVREQVAELRGEPAPANFYAPPLKYADKAKKSA